MVFFTNCKPQDTTSRFMAVSLASNTVSVMHSDCSPQPLAPLGLGRSSPHRVAAWGHGVL